MRRLIPVVSRRRHEDRVEHLRDLVDTYRSSAAWWKGQANRHAREAAAEAERGDRLAAELEVCRHGCSAALGARAGSLSHADEARIRADAEHWRNHLAELTHERAVSPATGAAGDDPAPAAPNLYTCGRCGWTTDVGDDDLAGDELVVAQRIAHLCLAPVAS